MGPYKSREFGTGSGFMCIRIAWGARLSSEPQIYSWVSVPSFVEQTVEWDGKWVQD